MYCSKYHKDTVWLNSDEIDNILYYINVAIAEKYFSPRITFILRFLLYLSFF